MKAKVMILGVLCILGTTGYACCGKDVVCADFSEGRPLANDSGQMTRQYSDGCGRPGTSGVHADGGHNIVTCACHVKSDGTYEHARNRKHGDKDGCSDLCPLLPRDTSDPRRASI